MAVKIGQIRKNNNVDYLIPLSSTDLIIGRSELNNNTGFQDTYITNKNGTFQTGHYYYIRLNIERINVALPMGTAGGSADIDPHYQNIDIRLLDNNNNVIQTLETNLIVPPYTDSNQQNMNNTEAIFMGWCSSVINTAPLDAQTYFSLLNTEYQQKIEDITETNLLGFRNKYQVIELVFSPYVAAKTIAFILRRTTYDYNFGGRVVKFEGADIGDELGQSDICEIQNVLGNITADKIGVQTDPGSLIIVNGEGMRVGKSGTLEINCGIPITDLGFAAPAGNIKDFIVDYTYTE